MSPAIEHLLPGRDQAVRIAMPALNEAVMATLTPRLPSGAVLWDLRPLQDAQRSPIRGAVNLGQVDWLAEDKASGRLQPPSVIARILGRVGILPGRAIILYAGDRQDSLSLARRALESIDILHVDVLVDQDDDDRPACSRTTSPVRRDVPAIVPGL